MARILVPALLVSAAALSAAACGDDERVSPLGAGGGEATSSSSSGASTTTGAGGAEPPPPGDRVREVFQRDPFGNVAESHNLLWDGDFEWESAFADQYGWLEGMQFGLRRPLAGPECRSGLKCARLVADSGLIGLGLASASSALYGSVWLKPTGADCSVPEVSLFTDAFEEIRREDPLLAVDAAPDADGWCHFEGVVPQRRDKTYMLVEIPLLGVVAEVDDAVLRTATAEESQRPSLRSFAVPTAERARRVEKAREALRITRGPRDDAPDPARRAFERWGRGEGRTRILATPRVQGGGR